MPSLYSFVSMQSRRSTNCVSIEGKHTNNLLRSRKLWQENCWWDIQNFTSMTHPLIWTHFILANLPFQDFLNHIYCLQHLKQIWREAVHGSPGRTHSCNHPLLHWKIPGCWQLLGPSSHAMPKGRVLVFLLDFCSTEKLSLQEGWRFFGLRLPSYSSSPLSLPLHKQENTKWALFLLTVPPAFQIEKVGVDFTLSLPPESTFSYWVPLTASVCRFHLLSLLSSVFCHRPQGLWIVSWLTPEGYLHLSSPFTHQSS